MERISVIVPIYKVEPYLDRCVQSIVDQTYRELEIILVDDGSPDRCPAMCDAWAQKDKRIKVIHKVNGGLSDARNAGLAIATGAYISFIDSDDWVAQEFLSQLYCLITEKNADIVICGVSLVAENGEPLCTRTCGQAYLEMGRIEALRRLILEDGVTQTVWNKLYRREVMENTLFEVGKYHEDDFWSYRVFDRAEKIAAIDQPLYFYFQRAESIMGNGFSMKRLDGLEARFQRMEYLQKYPELAALTREQLHGDCMYLYQCAARCLKDEERKQVLRLIRDREKQLPMPLSCKTISPKYRCWFLAFRSCPDFVVFVRNKLKIGL